MNWRKYITVVLAGWVTCGWVNHTFAQEKRVDEPTVVAVLRDFESGGPRPGPAIVQWSWTAKQKAAAGEYSQVAVVDGSPFGQRCLKMTIGPDLPWGRMAMYRAMLIGPDYLPPQADAVRMRVKVVSGRFELTVGGPTVYFGHSDVHAAPQVVEPTADGEWQTLVFSLNEDLMRNFRRARFGKESPVISYVRWIQEPLGLVILRQSEGEILIDQIELISLGQGKAYPQFDDVQVKRVGLIADFEKPEELADAFTFFQDPIDLTGEPKVARPTWPPPTVQRVAEGKDGGFSLEMSQKGTEEVAFAGLKVEGVEGANAIAMTIRAEHPEAMKELAVDLVAYVTPTGEPIDWQRFAPPLAWQKQEKIAYTYYLSQQAMRGTSYGFYHARRAIPNGQWQRVVIPLADFQCAYGQGDAEAMFRRQLPLESSKIIALGFIPPYRQRSGVTRLLIDDVAFVNVPADGQSLRSFWQHADVSKVILEGMKEDAYGGVRQRRSP